MEENWKIIIDSYECDYGKYREGAPDLTCLFHSNKGKKCCEELCPIKHASQPTVPANEADTAYELNPLTKED